MRSFILILILTAPDLLAEGGQTHKPAPEQGRSLTVSARVGEVSRLDGEVRLKRRGDVDQRPLHLGERLSAGDVVTTGEQGQAEWSLSPDSYFQIGHNSQVYLYEADLAHVHFDIDRGDAFILINHLDSHTSLELETPRALLNVTRRGSYAIRVAANGDTEATVIQGELQFVNDKGETIKVTKHKRVRLFAVKE